MYIIFIEGWVWLKEIVLVCTVFGYIRDMYIYIYIYQFKWRGYRFCRSLFNITWRKDIQNSLDVPWTPRWTSGCKASPRRAGLWFQWFLQLWPISWCCLGEWSGWDGNLVRVPVFSYCPPKNAFSKWSPCSYWTIDYRVEGGKKNKGIRFMSICEVLFSGHVRFVRSTSDFERSWLERSLDLWLLQAFGRHDL